MSETKLSPKRQTPNIKTCFIAASFMTDLTVVKAVLHERGITPVIPLETVIETDSLLSLLRNEIKKANLFLAILTPESQNSNVLFEIGCAYGLQKQLLIMAPKGVNLPFDMQGLQYIRADAQNREALTFALDQALAPKRSSTQRKVDIEKTKPLGKNIDPLLARLHTVPLPREAELVQIVAKALEQSGALTVVEHGPQDRGFDLGVWADELEPWVGNPLLIEVKTRLPANDSIVDHLMARVHSDPTRWALLLYTEGVPAPFQRNFGGFPHLLVLSIEELLTQLEHRSFGEIIRSLRNKLVHGVE